MKACILAAVLSLSLSFCPAWAADPPASAAPGAAANQKKQQGPLKTGGASSNTLPPDTGGSDPGAGGSGAAAGGSGGNGPILNKSGQDDPLHGQGEMLPASDGDLEQLTKQARSILTDANLCAGLKCPVADCAVAVRQMQALVDADAVLNAMAKYLGLADATARQLITDLLNSSHLTGTILIQVQTSIAYQDYLTKLSDNIMKLVNIADAMEKGAPTDADSLHTMASGLKSAAELLSQSAEAPPPFTDEFNEVWDVGSLSKNFGKLVDKGDPKSALKIVQKVLSYWSKGIIKKQKEVAVTLLKQSGPDAAALKNAYENLARIHKRIAAVEDAQAAMRQAKDALSACMDKAKCARPTLSRPSIPDYPSYGVGLRALSAMLVKVQAALAGSVAARNACPVPGTALVLPGGPLPGPGTGGGKTGPGAPPPGGSDGPPQSGPGPVTDGPVPYHPKKRHPLVWFKCPACKVWQLKILKAYDDYDYYDGQIQQIQDNQDKAQRLDREVGDLRGQMARLDDEIRTLRASLGLSVPEIAGGNLVAGVPGGAPLVAAAAAAKLRKDAETQITIDQLGALRNDIRNKISQKETESARLKKEMDDLPTLERQRDESVKQATEYTDELAKCESSCALTPPPPPPPPPPHAGGKKPVPIPRTIKTSCAACKGFADEAQRQYDRWYEAPYDPRSAVWKAEADKQEGLMKACEKNCGLVEQTDMRLESVIPVAGNNPFDAQNPLGGSRLATPGIPVPAAGCKGVQPGTETQTAACPAGQTGTIIQARSYACVGTTWTPGAYQTLSNSCATPPPAGCSGSPPPSETQTLSCPAGQTGTIIQARSYACVGTTWTPGAYQTVSNSCATPPPAVCSGAQPPAESQTLSCPAGQTGVITQTRSYSCVGTTWTPGAYQTVSNSCVALPSGCATNYSSGSYACSGSCGISAATLTVTPGSATMTAGNFGANSNVGFNCAGPSATSQSTTLVILGLSGHRCSLAGTSASAFSVSCQNTSGGSCSASCSR